MYSVQLNGCVTNCDRTRNIVIIGSGPKEESGLKIQYWGERDISSPEDATGEIAGIGKSGAKGDWFIGMGGWKHGE
jgi:hypothetical protein